MLTLKQALKKATDPLSRQVIDEFRRDMLFELCVFDDCVTFNGGTMAYVYERITGKPSVDYRAMGSEYTKGNIPSTQITAPLKIFGGSFDIDRVAYASDQSSVRLAHELSMKIGATKALFADSFINGDAATAGFDGIEKVVAGTANDLIPTAVIDVSDSAKITANGALLMDHLDRMLADLDGNADALFVNKKLFAVLNGIARRSGYFSTSDVDAFGSPVTKYAGIPIVALGSKPQTAAPMIGINGTGETSMYAVRFGLDGVHAVTPAHTPILNVYLPNFSAPGAVKKGEVEMVAGLAIKTTGSVGALRKIKV